MQMEAASPVHTQPETYVNLTKQTQVKCSNRCPYQKDFDISNQQMLL